MGRVTKKAAPKKAAPRKRTSDTALKAWVNKINKDHGPGTIVTGVEAKNMKITRTTSGSLSLDVALGGGFPNNQWTEIIGQESSGKTAMVLKMVAANQAANPKHRTFWVAAETLPSEWAEQCGVDLDRMVVTETPIMEEALEIALEALESRMFDMFVLDSYPALVSIAEDEKDMDEQSMSPGARVFGKFFRKANKAIKRSLIEYDRPVLPIIINQWRDKIGGYGDPRTTPGGKGKNFFYFTRVEVKRDEWLVDESKAKIGQRVQFFTSKNKTAPGQRLAYANFYFDHGGPVPKGDYDTCYEVGLVALERHVIEKKGARYMFGGTEIARSKDGVTLALRAEPELLASVDAAVRATLEPPKTKPVLKKKPLKKVAKK